ncbi:polysaccharide deacetylase family protein [Kitasatospora aureofaciens]|uniref:polysaccharide deacetylase family protein n=1 Tax=Kitasatospora aureofaciens TaxID=1894 RepID=UPI000525119F|nr:polysaccharide deacetylase family protein [Kitasatospora aureofaciens]HJD82588.1 polysaccharide deacetylase family protein [Kitasatospora aureofaciens]
MTADRRTVLRTAAKLAALSASAGLLTSCGSDTPRRAEPGAALAAHPGSVDDPQHTTDPAWKGGEEPASPSPTGPAPTATGTPAAPQTSAPPTPPVLPPLAAGTPYEVVHGPRTAKNVALTCHGSGDPKLATALLETAEQHGARLTVMVVGSWLDQQPQMVRRILDAGHELGNHTQNHLDISSMSPDQARAEIAQCADRLKALTGSIGRWFRPSAAQYATSMVAQQAKAVGYEHVLSFDVDPRDYTDPTAAELQRRVLSAVRGGSVVALHMGHQCTIDALPAILDGLGKAGLKAVTASQLCA